MPGMCLTLCLELISFQPHSNLGQNLRSKIGFHFNTDVLFTRCLITIVCDLFLLQKAEVLIYLLVTFQMEIVSNRETY